MQINYQNYTDAELAEARKALPKHYHDMNADQKAVLLVIYQEQIKRYKKTRQANFDQYNKQVEVAGYKVGDTVNCLALSLFGLGGEKITGRVAKRKKYYVRLDMPFNGRKTAHLTKAWKREV